MGNTKELELFSNIGNALDIQHKNTQGLGSIFSNISPMAIVDVLFSICTCFSRRCTWGVGEGGGD
jgi:hypothetical protein